MSGVQGGSPEPSGPLPDRLLEARIEHSECHSARLNPPRLSASSAQVHYTIETLGSGSKWETKGVREGELHSAGPTACGLAQRFG
jgi:hypothetical protein